MSMLLGRAANATDGPYRCDADGIFVPEHAVQHRDDEFESFGFDVLREMQEKHFWYHGRHRFLLHAARRHARGDADRPGRWIDLGGGCGGWIKYLIESGEGRRAALALADSSRKALEIAGPCLDDSVSRYQIDLMNLGWRDRWDTAFLLDVLEHIPEDAAALAEIAASLRPGGTLIVATPALEKFRSYNDELAHHVRRYSTRDYARLAQRTGLELLDARYFMFFLSPLYVASRWFAPDVAKMTTEELQAHLARSHRVPAAPLNWLLRGIFACETPLGHWLPFPWGTSILGVFRKPA